MSALIPRDNSFDCSPGIHEITVLLPDEISNIEKRANFILCFPVVYREISVK